MDHVTCPRPESLVPLALGADDPTISRHITSCAACEGELARIRETADVLRGGMVAEHPTETLECLDELSIADFVDGRLSQEARAPAVTHLLSCGRCRSAVQATARLLADPAVRQELRGPVGRRWPRWAAPIGAAAAVVGLLLLRPRSAQEPGGPPAMREPPSPSVAAHLPQAPRAAVARVERFVWSSEPGADRYRLHLYDAEGAVLWTAETADTAIPRPDSIRLVSGLAYFWKIEAQTEPGRWTASDLAEFRVIGPGR